MENVNLSPSGESASDTSKSLKYLLVNSKGDCKICLIGGLASKNLLVGKVLTDGAFKAVEGDSEITATALEESIQHTLDYDLAYPPMIQGVRIRVKSNFNQLKQVEQPLIIETVDRFKNAQRVEIEAVHEKGGSFIYPVNQTMTPDKVMYLKLLSSIEVEIEVIYA